MTEEVKTGASRANKISDIITVGYDNKEAVIAALQKIQEVVDANGAELIDCSNVIQVDADGNQTLNNSVNETHNLVIIPTYESGEKKDKRLLYVSLALTPKFEKILEMPVGLKFLEENFTSRIVKKIRDNVRLAKIENRAYSLPTDIADFLTPARAVGASEPLKRAIADFVKICIEKFKAKYPTARAVLTAKNMQMALANESFAVQVFPFLCKQNESGEKVSVLDSFLEKIKKDFETQGIPTAEVDNMLATRHNVVADESVDESDDLSDLF